MPDPYTIWALAAPLDKRGVPVMGTSGSTVGNVVVMTTETFKRLIKEHPTLESAEFRIGYVED